MKAINEHFEVGQQYYALVSKEVLVVSEVLQPECTRQAPEDTIRSGRRWFGSEVRRLA